MFHCLPLIFALHIPDGFLNGPICLLTAVTATAIVAVSLSKVQKQYQDRLVPVMGVCAAFIFAAQMINFPVPGGTSGHLIGGTLAAILLGPWAGCLVMSVVLIVQSLFFQDGGIIVLGANVLNMGLATTLLSYYGYKMIRLWLGWNRWRSMAIACGSMAWLSVMVAALLTGWQLAASETIPFIVVMPSLLLWHTLIGIGEAIITVMVIRSLWETRPDLLFDPPKIRRLTPRL